MVPQQSALYGGIELGQGLEGRRDAQQNLFQQVGSRIAPYRWHFYSPLDLGELTKPSRLLNAIGRCPPGDPLYALRAPSL